MADKYTNDPTRNASARTTHDPTVSQGGGATIIEADGVSAGTASLSIIAAAIFAGVLALRVGSFVNLSITA